MSFIKRSLSITLEYATGTDPAAAKTKLTLTGPRLIVGISLAGGPSYGQADIRLYGLSIDHINQVAKFQQAGIALRNNSVTVEATVGGGQPALVFIGMIMNAWVDMNGQPEVFVHISAISTTFQGYTAVSSRSYPGPADAAVILQDIAASASMGFENHGVSVILPKSHFSGTPKDQIQAVVDAANISFSIEINTLIIWPKNKSRDGGVTKTTPVISSATGMVGYPSFSGSAVSVMMIYNPNIKLGQSEPAS